MKIQIYSIKTPDDAALCAAAGVDLIGVAPGVGGEVDLAASRAIFAAIPAESDSRRVMLTLAGEPATIIAQVEAIQPDIVHLSGEIDQLSPRQVGELRRRLSPVKIMQAIPIDGPVAVRRALAYQSVSDYFILDSDTPTVEGIGATGLVHDWQISAEIVRRVSIPVILAGGLSATNVGEAIRVVRPWAVDSFTHTNTPGTKRKDRERVAAFIAAAREVW